MEINLENLVENMEEAFAVVTPRQDDSCDIRFSNKKWNELVEKVGIKIIHQKTHEFLFTVLETGSSIEIKDCELANGDNPFYYNFLLYKYDGGVVILGRQVYNAPSQMRVKISEAIAQLDEKIERNKHAKRSR